MRFGVRSRLFGALLALILFALAVFVFVLSVFLRNNLNTRIEIEIGRQAASARVAVEAGPTIDDPVAADALADRLGAASGSRITIIREDGRVTGDSELDPEEISSVENHGDREEVRAALTTGTGHSRRFSTTLDRQMLYVAARFTHSQGRGVVRVSKPLAEIIEAVAELRYLIIIAALVALVIAALMSALSSHLFSRTLRVLVEFARKTAAGERDGGHLEISSPDELGGLAGSLNTLSEQLERHVATLAAERDQFEAVLEGMSEAILALDDDQKVTLINRAGILLLGLSGEPIGQMLLETIRIPDLHELVADPDPGSERTTEFDLPGEPTRRIKAHATLPRTGGTVIVLQDVTERRRLENVRRDFVSNVSHELRTPVSIIRANTETLLGGAIDDREAAERFLGSMLTNAERLGSLISDLLDISRIEAGKYALSVAPTSVSISMRRAAAALETQAIVKQFTIKVETPENLEVAADVKALDQILFNLTDNAVKYAREGGQVVLRARQLDDVIRIEVEDDGPGITEENRGRLFERFFRVDTGRSREMGGTGLGLAIVKHLALAMDGEVGVEPVTPHGSLFWITLASA